MRVERIPLVVVHSTEVDHHTIILYCEEEEKAEDSFNFQTVVPPAVGYRGRGN